jgi:hypothetical protein
LSPCPPTIVADRNSTTVLSAVVRDSLSNIVVDANLEIHFNISRDLAEITGPQTAMTEDGDARTILRSSIRAGEVEITATVPGLVTGQTRLNLTAGPAVKMQLRATPTALPADLISTSQLTAEVLDVHGNQLADDSTTAISFFVYASPGEILAPAFSLPHAGQANALLQSTGPPGKILVFAGASGLASATFEIRVRQAQVPHFTDELPTLNLVEDGPAVRLVLSALTNDGDSNLEDLRFAVTADSVQVRLEIEGYELVATPVIRDYWGHLTATLTLRDPTGLESSAPAPVEVAWIDSLYIYSLRATDTDDNTLAYNIVEGPADMRYQPALRLARLGAGRGRFRRSRNNLERLRQPGDNSTTLPTPSVTAGQPNADRPAERPGIRTWRGACRAARTRSTGHRSRPQRPGSSLVICPPLW